MPIKRRAGCTTFLGSAPLQLACVEYLGRLSVASNGSRWLDAHQTRKKKPSGQVKVNRFA
jgi:hypothetical protein